MRFLFSEACTGVSFLYGVVTFIACFTYGKGLMAIEIIFECW